MLTRWGSFFVYVATVLVAVASQPCLVVHAACSHSLVDVAPAEGETYTVRAGECAGSIVISNNNVTVNIEAGAGKFQDGKSIVLLGTHRPCQ
jgi:hypothetical protein